MTNVARRRRGFTRPLEAQTGIRCPSSVATPGIETAHPCTRAAGGYPNPESAAESGTARSTAPTAPVPARWPDRATEVVSAPGTHAYGRTEGDSLAGSRDSEAGVEVGAGR